MTTTGTEQGTGLAEATRRIAALRDELQTEHVRHQAELESLERQIAEATQHRDLILSGATLDIVEVAESVLEVKGREHVGDGDGRKVVAKAIRDLAAGAPHLRKFYLGTKHYDRWHGQEEGGSYGSSPAHGYALLYIGLVEECRDHLEWKRGERNRTVEGRPLTEAETDAAIAYLHALLGTLARP